MPEAIIVCHGSPSPGHGEAFHGFVPCFEARLAEELLQKVWVRLGSEASVRATARLVKIGLSDTEATEIINKALLRYGVRRLELLVTEVLQTGTTPDTKTATWDLSTNDIAHLLASAEAKVCSYQRQTGRDLFCMAAGAGDKTTHFIVEGRNAAPTSRPLCKSCQLPDTDYLCSNLLHAQVIGMEATGRIVERRIVDALCDRGRPEIQTPSACHPGGHSCWQRSIIVEPEQSSYISPLGLAESFDVLDGTWRLAFGRKKRLLSVSTVTAPALLSLECGSRVDFESMLSALADLIDRLKVNRDLLPPELKDDEIKGSIDRIERCLLHHLPEVQHQTILKALQTIRKVRQLRNAAQHSGVEGGLTSKLRALNIHDAPPNWRQAWDAVRSITADALDTIRHELSRWIEVSDSGRE